jgi:hypothetical protein
MGMMRSGPAVKSVLQNLQGKDAAHRRFAAAADGEDSTASTVRRCNVGHAGFCQALSAAHLAFAVSSLVRASTQRAPFGVCSFFQNGASVFR